MEQGQRLRIMNDNQVILLLELLCDPPRIGEIHFSLAGRQLMLRSLEAVVNELGDFEEVRVSPDDPPICFQSEVA